MSQQSSGVGVVGRDQLIAKIWKALERDSLRFTAERRIGKTTVMKKMADEPHEGWHVVFIDLEAVDSPQGFVEALLSKVRPLMPIGQLGNQLFHSMIGAIGGVEIGGVIKLPQFKEIGWRGAIEKAFEGICSQLGSKKLLILFDELPYMLQKIAEDSSNKKAALEMLDMLRAIRGQHSANLRMIFAGSVGLHHVITDLRGDQFASQPVNDMRAMEIHPLEQDDAIQLASQLLSLEAIKVSKETTIDAIARELAIETDGVPFYLHRVIARLGELSHALELHDVRKVVGDQLTNDNDLWEMGHFRLRLKIYYPGSEQDANGKAILRSKIAMVVLDHLAMEEEPQTIEKVWQALKAKIAIEDRAVVVDLLGLLSQDHYLITDETKRYSFRFPLIQKWWVIAQGLQK